LLREEEARGKLVDRPLLLALRIIDIEEERHHATGPEDEVGQLVG
jgi:hypothetical protein